LTDILQSQELNQMMETLVPGFQNTIQGKNKVLGVSPSKFVTWHHVPGTNKLQLVWRYQHEQTKGVPFRNAQWQNLFHPGNRGGYADSALPDN
jgi:hypothetical protein